MLVFLILRFRARLGLKRRKWDQNEAKRAKNQNSEKQSRRHNVRIKCHDVDNNEIQLMQSTSRHCLRTSQCHSKDISRATPDVATSHCMSRCD